MNRVARDILRFTLASGLMLSAGGCGHKTSDDCKQKTGDGLCVDNAQSVIDNKTG